LRKFIDGNFIHLRLIEFFEALITVGSIGPKTAARAFSEPMARIAQAIDAGDYAFLVKLPGIGQQKARDIVAKLQGKVTKFLLIRDAERRSAEPIPDFGEEALAVLLQLQYKRSEAEARSLLAARNPQGRFITPQEVADTVLWLCTEGAASITGQAISLSGGETW